MDYVVLWVVCSYIRGGLAEWLDHIAGVLQRAGNPKAHRSCVIRAALARRQEDLQDQSPQEAMQWHRAPCRARRGVLRRGVPGSSQDFVRLQKPERPARRTMWTGSKRTGVRGQDAPDPRGDPPRLSPTGLPPVRAARARDLCSVREPVDNFWPGGGF